MEKEGKARLGLMIIILLVLKIKYRYHFDPSILKSSVNTELYSPLASKEVTGFGFKS